MESRKYPWHLHVSFWYPSPPAHRLQGILNLQDMPFWGSPCVFVFVCVCVCARVCACMCAVTLFPWVCMPVSWILLLLDLVSSLRSCFPPSKTTIYTHSCSFFPASFSSKYYSYIFMLTRRLTYYTVWPIIYSTYMWTSLVSLPQIYMKNQFVNKITFLQQDIELAKKFICFPVTSQKNPNKLFGQPNN